MINIILKNIDYVVIFFLTTNYVNKGDLILNFWVRILNMKIDKHKKNVLA